MLQDARRSKEFGFLKTNLLTRSITNQSSLCQVSIIILNNELIEVAQLKEVKGAKRGYNLWFRSFQGIGNYVSKISVVQLDKVIH